MDLSPVLHSEWPFSQRSGWVNCNQRERGRRIKPLVLHPKVQTSCFKLNLFLLPAYFPFCSLTDGKHTHTPWHIDTGFKQTYKRSPQVIPQALPSVVWCNASRKRWRGWKRRDGVVWGEGERGRKREKEGERALKRKNPAAVQSGCVVFAARQPVSCL